MNDKLFNFVCLASFLISFSYGVMLTLPLFLSLKLTLPLRISGEIISTGMIGVILSIFFMPYMLKKINTNIIAFVGALIYSVAIIFTLLDSKILLYVSGFMLGVGWGVIYTIGPIMVSTTSSLNGLSKNFILISAFNMLGAGLAPILVKKLTDQGLLINNIYFGAAFCSLVGGLIFLTIKTESKIGKNNLAILPMIKDVLKSKLIIPLIMVLLGACIFSSMMNFQFLFAKERHLDFSIFYFSYTFAILFARFFLTKITLKYKQEDAIIFLLILMFISLFLFLFVNNNFLYIISSGLLGISYGLVYPLIQTQMVKDLDIERRSVGLTIFSLSYFIGVFGYPYFFSLGVELGGVLISVIILMILTLIDIIFGFVLRIKQ